MPEDEDRPRDASGAADPGWPGGAKGGIDWAQITVPDDISELGRDIKAYHRENRAFRRRALLQRLSARPSTAPLTMAAAALLLAAVVALLLTVMSPARDGLAPRQLDVASPTASPGTPGGLLPDVVLRSSDGVTVKARSLRPAVLVSIPLNCGCEARLNQLSAEAYDQWRLPLDVIAPGSVDAEAGALVLTNGHASVYYDTSNTLRTQLHAQGVTVVLVNRDGTIYKEPRNVTASPDVAIGDLVKQMLATKATSG